MPATRPARPAARSSPAESPTRVERDTMGEMTVPADALFGASTQRAVQNFPISGRTVPFSIVSAYASIKSACATVNNKLGLLDKGRAAAIVGACRQIEAGLPDHGGWAKHFPIDVFQTGSGTSTNMNVNEVIANLVCLAKAKPIGASKDPDYLKAGGVHPNDHVNMGQSSNDTFPTAIHVAAGVAIERDLLPAVRAMTASLDQRAKAWNKLVKVGRTHLQDATPIRLGQEFSGFAQQMRYAERRAMDALDALSELAIGGTAVGTGINTHKDFGRMVCEELTRIYAAPARTRAKGAGGAHGPSFREAKNHFEAQHAKDAVVEASGHLRTIAVSLTKIAGDIRLMGCGPRSGIGELKIPAVQPGSSIMPAKVNPVIVEAVVMVACRVIGNDAGIATAGLGGVGGLLDLHVAMPEMAESLLESITLVARACAVFTDRLLGGLEPDKERCAALIEGSLAMCTSLAPVIGYDRAAAIAKQAYAEGKTVRQVALETGVLPEKRLAELLDPYAMTLPGVSAPAAAG